MIERLHIYAWDGVEIARGAADVVRWPFERAAWAIERAVLWPLGERTGGWSRSMRATGLALLLAAVVGVGTLAVVLVSSGGSGGATQTAGQTAAPTAAPPQPTAAEQAPSEPVLQGATPDFSPEANGAGTKAAATTEASTAATASPGGSATSSAATAAEDKVAGPGAIKVARQFSGAFVLFETGRNDAEVRATFAATATPELVSSLLQRPPRLPANAEVPRAKVLNLVAGPRQGDTYTLSVSLLRLGVTSELRVTMERSEKTGKWQVVDVLG